MSSVTTVTGVETTPGEDVQKWLAAAELSPVVALVLAGISTAVPGEIKYCNAAAKRLFSRGKTLATSASTIYDLVDSASHELLLELMLVADPVAPLEVTVELVGIAATGLPGVGPSTVPERSVSLLLQALPDGDFVAQIIGSDGWQAVDQVLSEQKRFRSALMELTELSHTTSEDDVFYQRLIELAVQVVPGAQGGSVQLNIPNTAAFQFVSAVGYDLAGLQEHVLEQQHFFRDAWDPRAQIIRTFTNEGRTPEIAEWLETVGRLSEIVVNTSAPVVVQGRPVAFLSLDNFEDPEAMNETSVEMTTVLSRLIGDLWLRRQLEAEVRKEREAFRHQALHDPLTGVANRRSLDRSIAEMIRENAVKKAGSAVLFFDIDDFKGVNDRQGHEVGDLLLSSVASELCKVVPNGDLVGRWGGDEFLVVPASVETPEQAMDLAVRILEHFETALSLDGDVEYRARLSVGVGWSETSQVESIDLVRAADDALYEAKASGKGTARLSLS